MIRRINRFHGHHSVSKVRGSVVHSQHFSLRFGKSLSSEYRLAVVVSKKVSKSAVVRNRIRRRIFEAVRTQGLFENTKIDLIFYAKDISPATMEWQELADEVQSASKKVLTPSNSSTR